MDLAVPVDAASGSYIAYIRDNRATVDALTSELLSIILRALVLGLVICVILSFLLSQILITPIRALTIGTKRVAAGDYTCLLYTSPSPRLYRPRHGRQPR